MGEQERVPTLFVLPLCLFFVALVLLIALLNRQSGLAVLSILVLGMATITKLWTRMSLSGLKSYVKVDQWRVFPEEEITLNVNVANVKFLPIWLKAKVEVEGLFDASSHERTLTKGSSLLWYQKVGIEWKLFAQKRGIYKIGPMRLGAGDLFGFFSSEKTIDEAISVIVYPRLIPLKSFSLPRREFFGKPGAKSLVQDPVYILGTHDYQPWQPSKYIHWKVSAHHNRLQAKVFEPSAQEKVLLAIQVDQFASQKAEPEFERTLEVVASLAVRLDHQGYALGFVTNGRVKRGGSSIVPIARHPHQLPAILEVLARLQMEVGQDFISTLEMGSAFLWDRSCIFFTYEEDRMSHIVEEYFHYRKIPLMAFVCQPFSSPEGGGQMISPKVHRLDEICLK